MKRMILAFGLVVSTLGFSQHGFINSSDFLDDDIESSFSLNLYGEGFVNSNSISNSVFNKAFQGQSLEGDLKANIFDRLKEENRLVADVYGGFNAFYIQEDKNQIFSFGIDQRYFVTSKFNDDFAKLMLNGNQPYQNQTLDFGSLGYQQQSYQTFKLGYVKKLEKIGIAFGANLGLVRGLSFQSVDVERGELFTATDGESVELDVKARILQASQTGGNYGTSADFYIEKYIGDKNKFAFKINDLGFVKWNNLTSYSADDSYDFEGIVIEDLFNIDTTAFNDLKGKNSAQEILGLEEDTISVTQWLPSLLQLDYTHHFSNKFTMAVGVLYQASLGALPALDVEADYTLPFGLTLIGELDYGGYGRLNYAVGAKAALLKKKLFILGKFYVLENLIAAKGTSGEGANMYIQYIF